MKTYSCSFFYEFWFATYIELFWYMLIFLMSSYVVYSASFKFNYFIYGCQFVLAPFVEDSVFLIE